MSTFRFFKKTTDTLPSLIMNLEVNGALLNLSAAGTTVTLRWKSNINPTLPVQTRTATILDPIYGAVEYQWLADEPGSDAEYLFEWLVTYAGGASVTIPNDGEFFIEVTPNLS